MNLNFHLTYCDFNFKKEEVIGKLDDRKSMSLGGRGWGWVSGLWALVLAGPAAFRCVPR